MKPCSLARMARAWRSATDATSVTSGGRRESHSGPAIILARGEPARGAQLFAWTAAACSGCTRKAPWSSSEVGEAALTAV
eukprot:scaffold2489_cov110-Isochrysis_galbana.AAC.8